MDGRIGQLDCRFRLGGEPDVVRSVAARLKSVAQERLPVSYAASLDAALADDPTVYVLRRVDCPLSLAIAADATDDDLAKRWSERLAGAVVRTIARSGDDMVSFASQSDFVARFVTDMLRGVAWERWFYGAFAALRPLPPADAVRAVLLDHRDCLPEVLTALHRMGVLEVMLQALDPPTLRELWSQGLLPSTLGADEARVFFAAALALIDALGLWARPRPSQDVLQAYLAARPPAADWRDRRSLAMAVLDVLRFLVAQGYLRRPAATAAGLSLVPGNVADGTDSTLQERLNRVLAALDWLDTEWLRERVVELVAPPAVPSGDLPQRPHGTSLTPRQHALLADLLVVLRAHGWQLDSSQPEAAANALRLHTWLLAHNDSWAAEPMTSMLIERLLRAWRWVTLAASPVHALRLLQEHNIDGAIRMLADPSPRIAHECFQWLANLGPSGLAIVEILISIHSQPQDVRDTARLSHLLIDRSRWTAARERPLDPAHSRDSGALPNRSSGRTRGDVARPEEPTTVFASSRPSATTIMVETECAGVALLLRAILDARLSGMLHSIDYPAPDLPHATCLHAALLALGLRWSGSSGLAAGQIDAGLRLFTGCDAVGEDAPDSIEALRALWTSDRADHNGFQRALLRILLGQRLTHGSMLHLYHIALADGAQALIAADESVALWPLGRIIQSSDEVNDTIAAWRATWSELTGHSPTCVADDVLAQFPDLMPDAMVARSRQDAEALAVHRAGRERLTAALGALAYGQLGLPQADLTLALTALALLRLWARWLRQFADSSIPYLLKNFIRRPGRLYSRPDGLIIQLEPLPLDIVIEMAGYTAPLEQVPWMDRLGVRFTIGAQTP